jgi:methionyl-tRNA formyltransferase
MLVTERVGAGEPGGLEVSDGHMIVACAQNTWIEIMELQVEGKKRMAASDFLRGAGLKPGTRLG